MKTIEEMFQEWLKNVYPIYYQEQSSLPGTVRGLRRAFFAGFNRSYCISLDRHGGFTIPDYEKEMDDHTDAITEGRT